MKVRTVIAACALVAALGSPAVVAQEESEPPAAQPTDPAQEPAAPAEPAATPDASEEPEKKKKIPLGLYVYAGFGGGDPEPFNTSIVTTATAESENELDIDGLVYARAAIGWRLANKKGDFRLVFDGFSEKGYEYNAIGRQAALGPGSPTVTILEPLDWWRLNITDGVLHSERRPPSWSIENDTNGNGAADREDDLQYPTDEECATDPSRNCLDHTGNVADDLLNRFQNWDLLYGRVWGPRRFQGRWFAGLRYMIYEGNVLGSAWLNDSRPGEGFTDGTFLRSLNFSQKTTGFGPTGLLEARWNFFGQRLQIYLHGQVAFLLTSIETDTGVFFTLVNTTTPPLVVVPLPARLDESRDKSIWNTKAEAGLRVLLKGGLEFELAYMVQGYLDTVLNPETIQIPATLSQSAQGVSAVYNTQDIVLDAWRFGIGFQF